MPTKAISKGTAKKSASRKPAKKTAKKKVILKKASVIEKAKKVTSGRKAAVKKKAVGNIIKKKAVRKTAAKAKQPTMSERFDIEPGPPPAGIPPVEEPAQHEEAVGTVTHYYSHLGVALVQINNGMLKTGDSIHIQGHTTDFTQLVKSMELEHQHVDQAAVGQLVGLQVKEPVREHDIVYVVR